MAENVLGMEAALRGFQYIGYNNTCYYFNKKEVWKMWNAVLGLVCTTPRDRYALRPPPGLHQLVFETELAHLWFILGQPIAEHESFDVYELTAGVFLYYNERVCFKMQA